MEGCPKKFNNVCDWNKHHRSRHSSVIYTCEKCGHISSSPIQHRDHIYLHKEMEFTCGCCYKSFPSVTRLNLHRHIHKRQRLYNCFSLNCKKEYMWPQDLLHHLKSHLLTSHKCSQCEYSNSEKRSFKQLFKYAHIQGCFKGQITIKSMLMYPKTKSILLSKMILSIYLVLTQAANHHTWRRTLDNSVNISKNTARKGPHLPSINIALPKAIYSLMLTNSRL